jgi:hypothetical protein
MIPFGGAKKSGYGLEFGVDGLKSVAVPRSSAGRRVSGRASSRPGPFELKILIIPNGPR